MTAQGEDILAWLDGAITRREETARATRWETIDTGDYLWDTKYLILRRGDESLVTTELDPQLAEHVALNDPSDVLRRCAADRKLMALHNVPAVVYPNSGARADDRRCVGCGFDSHEEPMVDDINGCPTLRAIAEGYGWAEGVQ